MLYLSGSSIFCCSFFTKHSVSLQKVFFLFFALARFEVSQRRRLKLLQFFAILFAFECIRE